jgi:putative membrane protein
MCGFLLRIVINAAVLFLLIFKLPGVFIDTLGGALLGVVLVGIANAAILPLLTCRTVLFHNWTLGGVTFLTNVFAPVAVIAALPGYQISSILSPAAGILCMTACSYTLSRIIQDR